MVDSGTPTFTVGTQDPTDGHVDVTVTGVPNGTKVKLPGVKEEKVVTDGKVTLPNDELPEIPQTGKGSAQEEGKLPKDGTSDITIPGKITSSKGEPEVQQDLPEFNGGVNTPNSPIHEIPDYKGQIGTSDVDENGNLITPPVVDIPEFNGGVNGEPEVQPELSEFNGGVNGEPGVQPELPEFNGGVDGEEQGEVNKPQPASSSPKVDENIKPESTAKVEKSTKRLANTGEFETNTGLAGLGLAMLGSLLAIAKRRREDEE